MSALQRIALFYRRQGLLATIKRFFTALHRSFFLGRMIIYSCPMPFEGIGLSAKANKVDFERATNAHLSKDDYATVLDIGSIEERSRDIANRFELGSELWLAKVNGRVAGFGWTLVGKTVSPHYFTLGANEVHFFDFHVFPEYRGRGINIALIEKILTTLSAQPLSRAHIECAAWNHAQIRSLSKTPFHRQAEVIRITFLGRTIIIWLTGSSIDGKVSFHKEPLQ
jgi:ribosomal protein S18 acetylase RimI-like enzyme